MFTVSMSGSNPSGASVNWATADGTATVADSDYQPLSGMPLTWAAGDTSPKYLIVTVNGDTKVEPNECPSKNAFSFEFVGVAEKYSSKTETTLCQNRDFFGKTGCGTFKSSRVKAMRKTFGRQRRLDCPSVTSVSLNLNCRNETIPILRGLCNTSIALPSPSSTV